jgi:hypothetical protein
VGERFLDAEEVGSSILPAPTIETRCAATGFAYLGISSMTPRSAFGPRLVRARELPDLLETIDDRGVGVLVEVSMHVEHGPCALVTEPVGDVLGGFALGDQDCHVGNPDDARSSVLALTPAGRRRLDAAQGSFEDELEARLGAALTPERLESLASTVQDVRRHIADQQGSS